MTDPLATIPAYVGFLLVFVALIVATLLGLGVNRTQKRLDLPMQTRRKTAILMAVISIVWLIAVPALAAAMNDVLPSLRPGTPNIGTLPFILTPIVAGLWLLRIPTWRQIADAVPLHWLTVVQFYRLVGAAVFLPLMVMGILPASFALPASYGDLIPALFAPIAAYWVWKRSKGWWSGALLLNTFGLLDFIVALGKGTGLSQVLLNDSPIITAHFAYFPLSLLPLFLVPIGIVLHLYSFRQLLSSNFRSISDRVASKAS